MAQETIVTYGGYRLQPAPLVSIQRDSVQVRSRDNPIGYTFQMTLSGTLTPYPADGGLSVMDGLIEELRNAFNRDGKQLLIECGPVGGPYTEIMSIYPRIGTLSLQESNNNWVRTIPYTINLEYDVDDFDEHFAGGSEVPPYVESFSEEWQVEFSQEKRYYQWDLSGVSNKQMGYDYSSSDSNNPWEARVTHTVSVQGKQSWAGPGATGTSTSAVDNALSWAFNIFNDFGYDHAMAVSLTGWTNLASGNAYDHYRTHSINETDGNVNLSETWLVLGTNSGLASGARKITEDFTVELRKSLENGLTTVSINGTIQGLEERAYTGSDLASNTTTSAYVNAESGWAAVENRLLPRSQFLYQKGNTGRLLNPATLNRVVGHSPSRGSITYSFDYDDRPCAYITGSLTENITINDTNPSDVFAKLTVLGRAAGPVLQAISTTTESVRDVTIEAIMNPPTGCNQGSIVTDLDTNKPTANVQNILCQFEQQLTGAYDQVFKNSDSESWNPLSGRYSRAVSWTYASCSGSNDTTLC